MADAKSRPLRADIAQAAREIAANLSADSSTQGESRGPISPAVSDLIYRGTRFWGLTQTRLKRLASKSPEPQIAALLSIAWAALHCEMRPSHLIVDESVAAAKALTDTKVAGFVNALLRKTLSDPDASRRDFEDPVARWNAPKWWIEKIKQDYAGQSESILDTLVQRAGLTIRLCGRHAPSIEAYSRLADACGLKARPLGAAAVALFPAVGVEKIPGFTEGWASVQDAAAQHACNIFDDQKSPPDHRLQILDACAAPGGKSIGLAQRYSGVVWAADSSAARLARLARDMARVRHTLLAEIRPVVINILDAGALEAAEMPKLFDFILLDAPCSASGVTRRHPDIAWKRTPLSIASVVDTQRRMLDILWPRLRPGGELVFVTCSVFSEEGEKQQQAFLDRTPGARLLTSPGRCLPQARPDAGQDQDGFFFAKFQKPPDETLPLSSVATLCDSTDRPHELPIGTGR